MDEEAAAEVSFKAYMNPVCECDVPPLCETDSRLPRAQVQLYSRLAQRSAQQV